MFLLSCPASWQLVNEIADLQCGIKSSGWRATLLMSYVSTIGQWLTIVKLGTISGMGHQKATT